MNIGKDCRIAHSAHLDKSVNPRGIHIGDRVWILRDAMVLAHDNCRSLKADTHIGNDSIIGVRSIIMPGISIGNQVVIGGGVSLQRIFPIIVWPLEIQPILSKLVYLLRMVKL